MVEPALMIDVTSLFVCTIKYSSYFCDSSLTHCTNILYFLWIFLFSLIIYPASGGIALETVCRFPAEEYPHTRLTSQVATTDENVRCILPKHHRAMTVRYDIVEFRLFLATDS